MKRKLEKVHSSKTGAVCIWVWRWVDLSLNPLPYLSDVFDQTGRPRSGLFILFDGPLMWKQKLPPPKLLHCSLGSWASQPSLALSSPGSDLDLVCPTSGVLMTACSVGGFWRGVRSKKCAERLHWGDFLCRLFFNCFSNKRFLFCPLYLTLFGIRNKVCV